MIVVIGSSVAHTAAQLHQQMMMDNLALSNSIGGLNYQKPLFVRQQQDHFDSSNSHTWQQAYYVNDTFWVHGSAAPVFLCVGGEGPALDGSAVSNSVHCNVAAEWLHETGALMFALEHRYYGCHNMSACPVEKFKNSTEDFKFLSSQQAIEDVATFVRQMNQQWGLSPNNKWVTWGGSYPGMLAGWSRLKHPELIHAAVASSAPVHAKLDMFEYNDAVAHAYTVTDNHVGGSVECQAAIRQGHETIEQMLQGKGGITSVEKTLQLEPGSLASKAKQIDILASGIANFPAQSNDPLCKDPACNIAKICQVMTNKSLGDELHRLLAVRSLQGEQHSVQGVNKNKLNAMTSQSWIDSWFYQTCTEFGFYQTCMANSSCMFVRGLLDVEAMAADCKKYGIEVADIARNIDKTNAHYGGLTPSSSSGKLGSCVVWPNGEVDPWYTLSVLTSPGPEQPVLWVPGASHHAWTHPSAAGDQYSVTLARQEIRNWVRNFLAADCLETTPALVI